ncbi:B3 domain-containing protein At1g05920-like [Humulus lupulus]|uniref:B3 domain-containing protein At1g05920-like n=1 Tax=Humulus lupulus TaxID=3486 RepID=UPI002B4055C1|nr:B3 domain-containing protein At1g05920-like [Humulus lupulus]
MSRIENFSKYGQTWRRFNALVDVCHQFLIADFVDDGPSSNSNCRVKAKENLKRKRFTDGVAAGPYPPPPITLALTRIISNARGIITPDATTDQESPVFIHQKMLFEADVSKQQGRLSMPISQIISDDFLNDDEKNKVERNEGMQVYIIQPNLDITSLVLKKWQYSKKNKASSPVSYVFIKNWLDVVKRNGLEKGHIVQLLFFRDINANPCFALVNLSNDST